MKKINELSVAHKKVLLVICVFIIYMIFSIFWYGKFYGKVMDHPIDVVLGAMSLTFFTCLSVWKKI